MSIIYRRSKIKQQALSDNAVYDSEEFEKIDRDIQSLIDEMYDDGSLIYNGIVDMSETSDTQEYIFKDTSSFAKFFYNLNLLQNENFLKVQSDIRIKIGVKLIQEIEYMED